MNKSKTDKAQLTYLEDRFLAASRDIGFLKTMKIPAIIMVLSAIFSGFIIYKGSTMKPVRQYYSVNSKGQIIQLYPLSQPIYTNREIAQFVTTALIDTFNYNFYSYKKHFRKMLSNYFTSTGMSSFMNSLKSSGNIDFVEKNSLIVKAVVTETPLVTKTMLINGVMTWHLLTKLTVTTSNGANTNSNSYDVYITVARSSKLSNSYGLRISQLVVRGDDENY